MSVTILRKNNSWYSPYIVPQNSTVIVNIPNPRNGHYIFNIAAKDKLNNAQDYQIFIDDINLFEDINTNIGNLTFEEKNITNHLPHHICGAHALLP